MCNCPYCDGYCEQEKDEPEFKVLRIDNYKPEPYDYERWKANGTVGSKSIQEAPDYGEEDDDDNDDGWDD